MKYLQYFDRDFFKFLAAFLMVVLVSVTIIYFTNSYHCQAIEADNGGNLVASPDAIC
jgi:hypothetical protein